MNLLAPSIAAAFLGSLAFAAWLLWLRRTDPLAAWAQERRAVQETLTTLRAGEAAFRAEMVKLTGLAGGDAEKLSKRVAAMELKVLGRQAP